MRRGTPARSRDEAEDDAETVKRESKSAREELEAKRREQGELLAEKNELKKKLYGAKEESKRQASERARRVDEDRDSRVRELMVDLQAARADLAPSRKAKDEAELELRQLRAKVQDL